MSPTDLPPRQVWNFWTPDEDRSSGWSNHTYVLQLVCQGEGRNPDEAWRDAHAREAIPGGWYREPVIATPLNHERKYTPTVGGLTQ